MGRSSGSANTVSQGNAAAAISPDGKTIAIARDGRLTLFDVASGSSTDLPAPSNQPGWISIGSATASSSSWASPPRRPAWI